MQSISLSRYRNKATLGSTKFVEMPTGIGVNKFVNEFGFIYASITQSLSNQINNLGSHNTDSKLIASRDGRFEKLTHGVHGEMVKINGNQYQITNVTKDDTSNVAPVYRISLTIKDGFNGNGE